MLENKNSCCICLIEETDKDIENNNTLIEYNHCGKYYIHNKCLDKWKYNECIICRKKINDNIEETDNEQSDNENLTQYINVVPHRFCNNIINICIIFTSYNILIYILYINNIYIYINE